MKNYNPILSETQQIPALSSGKTNKYEYLTSEQILPFDQSMITEQAKFTYYPLGKALEKQGKMIEDQEKNKQIDALNVLKPDIQQLTIKNEIPENQLSEKAKKEMEEIKKIEKRGGQRKFILRRNK